MTTPPSSLPPPESAPLSSSPKKTRKATQLRSLATKPVGMERLVVHVDPFARKVDGPHKKKLRTYLGIISRYKVDITFVNWKEVLVA